MRPCCMHWSVYRRHFASRESTPLCPAAGRRPVIMRVISYFSLLPSANAALTNRGYRFPLRKKNNEGNERTDIQMIWQLEIDLDYYCSRILVFCGLGLYGSSQQFHMHVYDVMAVAFVITGSLVLKLILTTPLVALKSFCQSPRRFDSRRRPIRTLLSIRATNQRPELPTDQPVGSRIANGRLA